MADLVLVRSKAKITAERREGGRLAGRVTSAFTDDRHFNDAADVLDVDKTALLGIIDAFQQGSEEKATVPLDAKAAPAFTAFVRGRLAKADGAVPHTSPDPLEALRAAIRTSTTAPEPLIYWEEGDDRLCMVDMDIHHADYAKRPAEATLYQWIERTSPRPAFAWSTHGRGLRLIYASAPPYTAGELAAVAALSLIDVEPLARIELKTVTRHPLYSLPSGRSCGPVRELMQTADTAALAAWLGKREVDPDKVEEWLTERSLSIGQRYDHDQCPVAPHEKGNRQPVHVREEGIFCHACNGHGVSRGHKIPGWFPYTSLIGQLVPSAVKLCLDNFTHWDHAKYVMADSVSLGYDVARKAYGAALKMLHGDDARVPRVFSAGRGFLRFERRWANAAGETMSEDTTAILSNLPACQYVDRKGKLAVNQETVARFKQPTDLAEFGYPAFTPVWGIKIYGHRLPNRDPNRVPIVMQRPNLRAECVSDFRPRYRPVSAREFDEDAAWAVLEEVFPGVNRRAVLLLIAAKGTAEGEVGMPPMVFISGPTGSSKTKTVQIAAAITGDGNHAVTWSNSVERVRQQLLEAKEGGSYAVFNEIVKDSTAAEGGLQKAMQFLLNLTPDSLSHKLYVGPVHMGSLPVCCFTDTSLPVEVKQNAQLARRVVHVHLPGAVDWEMSIQQTVGKVENLRLADPRYASACDTLLSVVVDRFFRYPMTFEEIAGELGYYKMRESVEADERNSILRELFRYVCAAPSISGPDARRWKGKGWKLIERHQETELAGIWKEVCNPDFVSSERTNETDWANLLGIPGPVLCEIRSHGGSKLAIRFVRHGEGRDYVVNEELGACNDKVELDSVAGQDGDDRPGNSEHAEPEGGR